MTFVATQLQSVNLSQPSVAVRITGQLLQDLIIVGDASTPGRCGFSNDQLDELDTFLLVIDLPAHLLPQFTWRLSQVLLHYNGDEDLAAATNALNGFTLHRVNSVA